MIENGGNDKYLKSLNSKLATIDKKLARIISQLPPDDSPTRDNMQCHLRKPNIPCNCIWWREITQQADTSRGEQASTVKGCGIELFPWMLAGVITSTNKSTIQSTAIRTDIHDLKQEVNNHQSMVGQAISLGLYIRESIAASVMPPKDMKSINGRRDSDDGALTAGVDSVLRIGD